MGDRESQERKERDAEERRRDDEKDDLEGLGQEGTSEPVPGVGENQGGGIEDAIGGGQSGQGGG